MIIFAKMYFIGPQSFCSISKNASIFQVVKNTGFLKGLYTADEMDSANVKVSQVQVSSLKAIGIILSHLFLYPSFDE